MNDHAIGLIVFVSVLILSANLVLAQEPKPSFLDQLNDQSRELSKTFGINESSNRQVEKYSELALAFVSATGSLNPLTARTVYRSKKTRTALSAAAFTELSSEEKEEFAATSCNESIYYGHYSTPLAWARPFDRLAQHGFESFDGKRVLDFGFGNVSQLRMMASLGADVTGIEIDGSVASALYVEDSDQGAVKKLSDKVKNNGSLKLVFGQWPAEEDVVERVGTGFDLFISKNVLKYGYIHPEKKAPTSQLIDLGVTDQQFLKRLMRILKPGGYALIYNIHPPRSKDEEIYKPWAYGETPWNRELVEKIGFEVINWHTDDSEGIHEFGLAIGWNSSFQTETEFKKNFRAMYTILHKPR